MTRGSLKRPGGMGHARETGKARVMACRDILGNRVIRARLTGRIMRWPAQAISLISRSRCIR